MLSKIKEILIIAVIVAVAAIGVDAYIHWRFAPPSARKEFQTAPQAPAAVDISRRRIEPKKDVGMEVLEKEEVAKKFKGVPKRIEENAEIQVTAIAEVPPHDGKTQVMSTFDMTSGKTEINYKQLDPPLLEVEFRKEAWGQYVWRYAQDRNFSQVDVGVSIYLIKGNFEIAKTRVTAELGGMAELNYPLDSKMRPEGKGGVRLNIRW